ncbi:MAG: LamG-like jellyroll fold domain-containing protein, partial [Planctomycetota bacterium]
VGVLGSDKSMALYVDGQLAGEGVAQALIQTDPAQGLDIGADAISPVGDYSAPSVFSGLIDEVRLYFHDVTAEQVRRRYEDGNELSNDAVLAVSFDDGTARDHSLHNNSGTLSNANVAEGKFGQAAKFSAKKKGGNSNNRPGNSLVDPKWTQDVSIYVRGMVLAGNHLFIVGPPDLIDEESTFEGLTNDDPETNALLKRQNEALAGSEGATLLAVNVDTGDVERELDLESLPTWDGLAGANGRLFLTTLDGAVMCFSSP